MHACTHVHIWIHTCLQVKSFPWRKEPGANPPTRSFKSSVFTPKKPKDTCGQVLKLTGSQSLHLALALPGIVWHHYNHDDPHWKCFTLHMICVAWSLEDTFLRLVHRLKKLNIELIVCISEVSCLCWINWGRSGGGCIMSSTTGKTL